MFNIKVGVISAASLLAGTALASAATINDSASFGPATTNWGTSVPNSGFSPTQPIAFAGFNTALGTLTGVKISIHGDVSGQISLKNTSDGTALIGAQLQNTEKVSLPGLGVTKLTDVSNTFSQLLGPGASAGPSAVSGSADAGPLAVPVGSLSSYTSAWNALAGDLGQALITNGAGNGTASFTDQGKVTINVVYTYTPAPPPPPPTPPPPGVPEPATMALLGSGLVGLGVLRRRRRG